MHTGCGREGGIWMLRDRPQRLAEQISYPSQVFMDAVRGYSHNTKMFLDEL